MAKHTQIIRRQQPANCLSVFDFFVRLANKGLIEDSVTKSCLTLHFFLFFVFNFDFVFFILQRLKWQLRR